MVWCGSNFLPGNRASKARFTNQKIKIKNLNLKSLVQSEIHQKKKKNLESQMGDLPRTYQRTQKKEKKKKRTQIDCALPGSVARGLDRTRNQT